MQGFCRFSCIHLVRSRALVLLMFRSKTRRRRASYVLLIDAGSGLLIPKGMMRGWRRTDPGRIGKLLMRELYPAADVEEKTRHNQTPYGGAQHIYTWIG